MNNLTHQLYVLTEQDDVYRQGIESLELEGLEITANREDATILLAAPPMAAKCLDNFPKLEWLQPAFAGVDALTSPNLRHDYELTNVKGIFAHNFGLWRDGFHLEHRIDFDKGY